MQHTDETKQKLSEMRKGKNNPFYGKHHTETFKRVLSERAKNQNAKRQYELQPQKIVIPSVIELAYLSGFCDADGSIRFVKTKSGYTRPFIAFYNTNVAVIDWIRNTLGHGSIQHHNKGRELVQSIRVDGARDVYALASAMLPFLIVKKDDALAVIQFLKSKYGDRLMPEKE